MAMHRLGGYDNHTPRAQQERLEGWGFRALSNHRNELEALLMFSVAFLAYLSLKGNDAQLRVTGQVYLLARVAYMAFYLLDLSTLRSTVWAVGFGSSLFLLIQAI
jgi:uncharacterized MAPEG superfamily protein